MDNLQSMTYQTFEQDPVKYERYEEVCTLIRGHGVNNNDGIGDRQFSEHSRSGHLDNECKHFDVVISPNN